MISGLQRQLGRNTWPPDKATAGVWEDVEMLAGLRLSDEFTLRSMAASFGMGVESSAYVDLPVPRLVSRLKSNLLFAEPPDIKAELASDQLLLDDLVEENDLVAELRRGALIASSEGEVYGRLVVDPQTLSWPIIEFCSRRWTLPRFAGRFLVGATFVREIAEGSSTVWRVLEDYGPGSIETQLWRGTSSQLGERRPLRARPETADLDGVVQPVPTGLAEPACVFIANTLDEDPTRGISDYLGVVRAFFAINESLSVGQANVRSTGLKRLFVDGRYRSERGTLPSGRDIFWTDSTLSDALGQGGGIKQAEYSFESSAMQAWHDHVIDLALTFCGVAPTSVGRQMESGHAMSGTALRLRMTHTLMEAAGTGRSWDRQTQRLLRMAQLLDQAQFNRGWKAPDRMPAFHRHDGLPRDSMEEAQETATLSTAGALSLDTKVRRVHPDWSDQQVAAEIARIQDEGSQATASARDRIAAQPPTAQAMLDAARGRLPNPQPSQGGRS